MEDLLAAIQGSWLSQTIRYSQWRYAWVNTAHVLGIALMIGAIVPMDLRLLGLAGRRIPHAELARLLLPVAIFGLTLAIATGAVLFIVRAKEYGYHPLLQIKVPLVILGSISALVFHARAGPWLERATPSQARLHAGLSLSCWAGAMVLGRMIAYWR